jgi:hypothetical protein
MAAFLLFRRDDLEQLFVLPIALSDVGLRLATASPDERDENQPITLQPRQRFTKNTPACPCALPRPMAIIVGMK